MYQFPIGAIVESFRCETHEAIKKAAAMGVQGLQMYCTNGEHAPENFSKEARRELLKFVKDHGLCFSALCGDLGRGFARADENPALIEKSKRIVDLALEMETNIVTTHIGVVPEDPSVERFKIMQEACYELAQYADSVGAHFAVETGPETSATLKAFLDTLGSRGVGVNLDPANLVMVSRDDPIQAVYNLKDYIVHTHAKDGKNLVPCHPEYIYGILHPVPTEFQGVKYYIETALGDGNVPFPAYLKALEDIGYKGFLTIEREVGDTPEADIKKAYDHLQNIIANN